MQWKYQAVIREGGGASDLREAVAGKQHEGEARGGLSTQGQDELGAVPDASHTSQHPAAYTSPQQLHVVLLQHKATCIKSPQLVACM